MKEHILVLRNVKPDMTSHNGFKYPKRGWIEAPDWEDTYKCGHGLHGLPWGCGATIYLYDDPNANWLVLKVNPADGYRAGGNELVQKCKFRRGYVVYWGTRDGAVNYLLTHGAADKPVVYAYKTDYATGSNVIVGDYGIATAGDYGTATTGDYGTATAGEGGAAIAGFGGTAITGNYGTAITGFGGIATAGFGGTATAGERGTATAGERGTAIADIGGMVTAGEKGIIKITYWDDELLKKPIRGMLKIIFQNDKSLKKHIKTGYIGENGLRPNTPYKLNDKHEFVEAEK